MIVIATFFFIKYLDVQRIIDTKAYTTDTNSECSEKIVFDEWQILKWNSMKLND